MTASTRKPSSRAASKRELRAAEAAEGTGRIVADVPWSEYVAVKTYCTEHRIEMRALVREALREKLKDRMP
jgi:tryptophan synthase alpha subunit